jgi:hypothetical protein
MELFQALIPYTLDFICIIVFLVYRERLIFTPLAGGNGVVQMDELSKGVIILVFYLSARAEAFRTTEYHVFSDAYWYALLGCVALIAGIKAGVFHKLTGSTPKAKKEEASQ